MNKIKHLIISNQIDYSTDLICLQLEKRGLSYLRLNRDQFQDYNIVYELKDNSISVNIDSYNYIISQDNLQSVFFRAPVFLRSNKPHSLREQLSRSQWSAFIRNLIVFDRCKWINHPVDTYRAENKMYQLKTAKDIGFITPDTYVTNSLPYNIEDDKHYIFKSLDTALFYDKEEELFTYSTLVCGKDLKSDKLRDAPVIIQEYLADKIDIRITVIGESIFPVVITKNGNGLTGDWRKFSKDSLSYTPVDLPSEIEMKIHTLMRFLNLRYGGLDMALCNGNYYFIEVNPTGEWGWLKYTANQNIDIEIVNCMTSNSL